MDRYVKVRLVDPSHKMPMPPPHRRLFGADQGAETVDTFDPFWAARLADGSIEPVSAATPASQPA